MTYFTREQVSGDAGCSILGRARKYGETSVSDGASVSRPRKQDESSLSQKLRSNSPAGRKMTQFFSSFGRTPWAQYA